MISNTTITIVKLPISWRFSIEWIVISAPYNRSVAQPDSSKTLITELKSTIHHHPSSKKSHPDQTRSPKTSSMTKGNKSKSKYSNHLPKKKHLIKIHKPMIIPSTGLSSKPIETISPTKTPKKSVTNAVISYLHYRGSNGSKPRTGRQMNGGLSNDHYACLAWINSTPLLIRWSNHFLFLALDKANSSEPTMVCRKRNQWTFSLILSLSSLITILRMIIMVDKILNHLWIKIIITIILHRRLNQ